MSGPIETRSFGSCDLYLGDSLSIIGALPAVDHIICDPPYEAFMHEAKDAARGKKAYGAKRRIRIDGHANPPPVDFSSVDGVREPFIEAIEGRCKGWLVVFATPEGVGRWADVINASSIRYKRACVWVKPDSAPQFNGQCPAMGAENFICAWAGAGVSRWNGGGKRGVYTHQTNPSDRDGRHPTEKPWRLMAEIIMDFTQPGDLILDPFMGSGSTGVACIRTGRRFIGIERDPKYFDVACSRVADATAQPDLFLSEKARRSMAGGSHQLPLEAAE